MWNRVCAPWSFPLDAPLLRAFCVYPHINHTTENHTETGLVAGALAFVELSGATLICLDDLLFGRNPSCLKVRQGTRSCPMPRSGVPYILCTGLVMM